MAGSIQDNIASTKINRRNEKFVNPSIRIKTKNFGKARKISLKRIHRKSVFVLLSPLVTPMIKPIKIEKREADRLINSDCRVAVSKRTKLSLPRLSVPSKCRKLTESKVLERS